LKEVVDGLADLDEEFEKIVDRVKGKEADRYIGEDGEGDDGEDGEGRMGRMKRNQMMIKIRERVNKDYSLP
jgi:hypothetical protein